MKAIVFFCLILFTLPSFALDVAKNPELENYVQYLTQKYQFDPAYLNQLFSSVTFNQDVLAKMDQATHPLPWYHYREMFITPKRIQEGVQFWQQNRVALATAQSQYGVPAEIIVGIIGVETSYGDNQGSFAILDTLATLAFDYPKRSKFFKNELTEYLLLCREQHWDPRTLKGSYAGALGLPQFMPSSYREYAVDYHRDGVKNLFASNEDVIVSIGNYLKKKGWKLNQPIIVLAKKQSPKADHLLSQGSKVRLTLKTLGKNGLVPAVKTPTHLRVGVVVLEEKNGTQPWIIFENFAVIKRYNSSDKYAMAVYQLGNLVKQAVYQSKTAS